MTTVAWVALGGAVGACLRVVVMTAVDGRLGSRFPHALYAVNTFGSLLLGILLGATDPAWHPFLISGLCGALTTFSTFAHSAVDLMREGRRNDVLIHIALNFGGSLAGVLLGLELGGA